MSAPKLATASWDDLARELDRWGEGGRRASVWWRDDDAARVGPRLERLIALAAAGRAGQTYPLALAVIPAVADPALGALDMPPSLTVLQHGYAHINHAPPGEKKAELHGSRERGALAAELRRGKELLGALFGRRFLPVMVPPWNRLDDALIGPIVALGFTGLSRFGARGRDRATEMPLAQIIEVNTHVDPIDWHGTRGFLGEELVLAALVDHLARRREGLAEGAEATGILTHHGIHDEACWAFLGRLLDRLAAHPAARLVSAVELFAESKP